MDSQGLEFSVLLPTYANDNPKELKTAIESVLNQSQMPDEIVIVKDGPLSPKLEATVKNLRAKQPSLFTLVQIEENQGLGNALQTGVEEAAHDYIARMDADDISVPTRFEQQLDYLTGHPNVDIVGGYIDEFDTDPSEPISWRKVPTDHEDIARMARFRSPMNHGTVLFNRKVVLRAGNYRAVDRMEDYDLWVRMLIQDATFSNLPEVLVHVRAGDNLYSRRGGWEYAREEARTQVEFHKRGFTSLPVFLFNTVTRVGLRLAPNTVRKQLYRIIAR